VLTGSVQPMGGTTPYIGWGNYPVIIFALFVVLGGVVVRRRAAT
jgi:apolipoprotein N-acyltransferase